MYRARERLYEQIRRGRRLYPTALARALARKCRTSRNTVAKALARPMPLSHGKPPPRKSVLEPVAGFIDAMPREDVNAPRKQRQTIDRICQRLAAEHASYSTVDDHLRNRRRLAGQCRRCEWDKSLTGPRPCAVIGDRITFKGTLIRTGTGSYRPKVTENGYRSTGRS